MTTRARATTSEVKDVEGGDDLKELDGGNEAHSRRMRIMNDDEDTGKPHC